MASRYVCTCTQNCSIWGRMDSWGQAFVIRLRCSAANKSSAMNVRLLLCRFESVKVCSRSSFGLSPALALLSSMAQRWYMDPDLLVPAVIDAVSGVLLKISPHSLTLLIWNTSHTCSWVRDLVLIWSARERIEGSMAAIRKQWLKRLFFPLSFLLRTQTSAEQRAGTLVCIKLSAIAAIICKSKTFRCALFLHHCV